MKDRESVTINGKASFYACILDDLKIAALSCGWALGIHGSLQNDMDIMAMPWTEDAADAKTLIKSLSECFNGNIFVEMNENPIYKPNNRVVYVMRIWKDWYLDINVIEFERCEKPEVEK